MEMKHALGATVKLRHSDETGEVIGRAEYSVSEPAYYVRYKAADGRQVEQWWGESAILA
jgi:hypothetical protein